MSIVSLPLEHLFTMRVAVGPRLIVAGPNGARWVHAVTGGTFEGPRLRGTIAESPGGDWAIERADGSVNVDVRLTLLTEDGAAILMFYTGVVVTKDGKRAIRTAARFETGDARHAWLNNVQGIGLGGAGEGGPVYEVYALL